jgi:hypothetical protein
MGSLEIIAGSRTKHTDDPNLVERAWFALKKWK